jgi:formate dehydrogenase subunit gamma
MIPNRHRLSVRLWCGLLLVAVLWAGSLSVAAAVGQPPGNPRSDIWRQVRQGESGTTTTASEAHEVLIQTEGELWREIRNGPLATISPWLLAGVLAAIGIFFLIVGRDRLEAPPSGLRLARFSLAERILHWTTATLFILLAFSGLSLLLGRALLIPLFGREAFAGAMQIGKLVHNISGPLFLAGLLIEVAVWVTDNIPKMMDLRWFRNLGGMIGDGPRPHAGKINGGEKAWFWAMVLAGLGVGITGVILDFPIWGQSRQTMQIAHVIHVVVATLFVAASFGHIYIGTIGVEGTFAAMWRGSVDAVWAKQHADRWYEAKVADKRHPS